MKPAYATSGGVTGGQGMDIGSLIGELGSAILGSKEAGRQQTEQNQWMNNLNYGGYGGAAGSGRDTAAYLRDQGPPPAVSSSLYT